MFISSLWDVREPTHYSRRVGDELPVLWLSCSLQQRVAGLAMMSLKRLVVYEETKQKQLQVKKGLCRVLEYVDVDVEHSSVPISVHQNLLMFINLGGSHLFQQFRGNV